MNANPTIRPNPSFNPQATAEMLRKAMKGLGCDKNKVIQALCTISNWQVGCKYSHRGCYHCLNTINTCDYSASRLPRPSSRCTGRT